MTQSEVIKNARRKANLTQKQLAETYNIPVSTLICWENGQRKAPEYVINLLLRCMEIDFALEQKQEYEEEQDNIEDEEYTLFDFPNPISNYPCEEYYSYEDERKLIFMARNINTGIVLSDTALRELIHAIHTNQVKLLRGSKNSDETKTKIFNYKGLIEITHDPSIYGWVKLT